VASIRLTAVLAALAMAGSSVAVMVCDGWCGAGRAVQAHCSDEMPLNAPSAISSAVRPCLSVLSEKALVREDGRRISMIALLSDMAVPLAERRARPTCGPDDVNQPQRKPFMVLRL
jgi:hypothetical protein